MDQGELELHCTLVASHTHTDTHQHWLSNDHRGIDYSKSEDELVNYSNKQDCGLPPLWSKFIQKKSFHFPSKMTLISVHCSLMGCVTTEMVILPLVSKLLFRKTVGEESKQVVGEGNVRVGGRLVFNAISTIQLLNRL